MFVVNFGVKLVIIINCPRLVFALCGVGVVAEAEKALVVSSVLGCFCLDCVTTVRH